MMPNEGTIIEIVMCKPFVYGTKHFDTILWHNNCVSVLVQKDPMVMMINHELEFIWVCFHSNNYKPISGTIAIDPQLG